MSNKNSVLIVAQDYDSEVLDTLVLNKIKIGFKVCVVKIPRLNKSALTDDIAVITGATCLNDTFDRILKSHLGSAEKIIIDKHNTTIVNGKGKNLPEHIEYLKQHNDLERAAKLEGGIATLYIGANSEVELKEKRDRIEDALCATKAAIEEGIVPGGGIIYINAISTLPTNLSESDVLTGVKIITNALTYPIKQICANAGVSGEVIINTILNNNTTNYGYDAKTNTFGNLINKGIIDPAKTVRIALENAASVAGLFLTTECVIVDDDI